MDAEKMKFATVDEYMDSLPEDTLKIAEQVRAVIKNSAPGAQEVISYNMPAYKLNGILVYFAAWKTHIGLYPGASGIEAFKNEFSANIWAKGSVQFPLAAPVPLKLISKIVEFRVSQNMSKAKQKPKQNKPKSNK
jgi:uncharacterized protein YdhG (YjbR/CyaY superfamily)